MKINVRYLNINQIEGNTSMHAISSNSNFECELTNFVVLLAEAGARLDQRSRNVSANTIEVSV